MTGFSAAQDRAIHEAASLMVAAAVGGTPPRLPDPALAGAAETLVAGAFVSLKLRGRLRGCCGVFDVSTSVIDAVSRAAVRTATADPRVPPVSAVELGHLDLEVWLLGEPRRIAARGDGRRSAVEIGRHGLYVRRGDAAGLLLPGVATEHGFDAERFLDETCLKAYLPPGAWKDDDVDVDTFEGHRIAAPFDARAAAAVPVAPAHAAIVAAKIARLARDR